MLKEAHRCQRKDEMWDDDWFYYHMVFFREKTGMKAKKKGGRSCWRGRDVCLEEKSLSWGRVSEELQAGS